MSRDLSAADVNEQAAGLLETDFGITYMGALNLQYNRLHQQAESFDLSPTQKASLIDQAAGLKFAISWLTERRDTHKRGGPKTT